MANTAAAFQFQHHAVDVNEEELMALRALATPAEAEEADAINRDTAAFLAALLQRVVDLEAAGVVSLGDLAWAEGTEGDAVQTAEEILQGAAVLEARSAEDAAAVPELRRQAARARAIAVEAGRVAAAARRLVETETRRLVALEHLVDPDVLGMLRRVAGEMDAAAVVSPEEVAAAVAAADRVEAEMVRLRVWLMLAASRAAERPGDAAALRMQAGKAKAVAAVHAFRESVSRY